MTMNSSCKRCFDKCQVTNLKMQEILIKIDNEADEHIKVKLLEKYKELTAEYLGLITELTKINASEYQDIWDRYENVVTDYKENNESLLADNKELIQMCNILITDRRVLMVIVFVLVAYITFSTIIRM